MNIIRKVGNKARLAAVAFFASVIVAHADSTLGSPLKPEFSTVPDFIAGVLRVVVMIALPIITLFIVIAGFRFIWAQGNQSELTEAKKNFVYVLIGSLLIMGSWALVTLIAGTVTQLVGKS